MADKMRMYVSICERAEKQGYKGERISLIMDIESADNVFNLRLDDWLNSDDANFAHDINGIISNIERTTFPATEFGFFVPRFSSAS